MHNDAITYVWTERKRAAARLVKQNKKTKQIGFACEYHIILHEKKTWGLI